MELDWNVGKPVTKVSRSGNNSKVTFEDGSVVTVPGNVAKDLVGKALLTVETAGPNQNLVFGHARGDGSPAVRTHVIPVPANFPAQGEKKTAEAPPAEAVEAPESDSEATDG